MATLDRSATFAARVRSLLDAREMSLAQLADQSDLQASFLSRLLSDNEATRREPRIEHVVSIARALETTPGELLQGTEHRSLVNDWVPRSEFEAECGERVKAQAESAKARAELSGCRRGVANQQLAMLQLSDRIRGLESENATMRQLLDESAAKIECLEVEHDDLVDLAQRNYIAYRNARSHFERLRRDVAHARGPERIAAVTSAFVIGVGAAVAAMDARPAKRLR